MVQNRRSLGNIILVFPVVPFEHCSQVLAYKSRSRLGAGQGFAIFFECVETHSKLVVGIGVVESDGQQGRRQDARDDLVQVVSVHYFALSALLRALALALAFFHSRSQQTA